MLVLFYIISAASSIMSTIYIQERNLKKWFIYTVISVTTGLAFCVPMIRHILSNLSRPSFWAIWAVLSLIAWQLAFIFNNDKNWLNYEFAFLLLSFVIYVFCSSFFYSNYLMSCRETHVTTKIFPIISRTDVTESSQDILENKFIVEKFFDMNSKQFIYQYEIQLENGESELQQTLERITSIEPISNSEVPYVEIITTHNCMGYRRQTLDHILTSSRKTYILHIPEDCIKNVSKLS